MYYQSSVLDVSSCTIRFPSTRVCIPATLGRQSFFFFLFFHLTYSRWTSSLPSCLWSQRIFPSLPGSRLTNFYRDASSALLQLVYQWLNEEHQLTIDSATDIPCIAQNPIRNYAKLRYNRVFQSRQALYHCVVLMARPSKFWDIFVSRLSSVINPCQWKP